MSDSFVIGLSLITQFPTLMYTDFDQLTVSSLNIPFNARLRSNKPFLKPAMMWTSRRIKLPINISSKHFFHYLIIIPCADWLFRLLLPSHKIVVPLFDRILVTGPRRPINRLKALTNKKTCPENKLPPNAQHNYLDL